MAHPILPEMGGTNKPSPQNGVYMGLLDWIYRSLLQAQSLEWLFFGKNEKIGSPAEFLRFPRLAMIT